MEEIQVCRSLDELGEKLPNLLGENEVEMIHYRFRYSCLSLELEAHEFLHQQIPVGSWNKIVKIYFPEHQRDDDPNASYQSRFLLMPIEEKMKDFREFQKASRLRAAYMLLYCLDQKSCAVNVADVFIRYIDTHCPITVKKKFIKMQNLIKSGATDSMPKFVEILELCEYKERDYPHIPPDKISEFGFTIDYLNHPIRSSLDHYVDHVGKCMEEYGMVDEKYYANCFSVVQSSGYGKSRMVFEAGKRHLNTVYACIRGSDLGYPRVHWNVRSYLSDKSNKENMLTFIWAIYETALELFKRPLLKPDLNERPLFQQCSTDLFKGFWDVVLKKCKDAKQYGPNSPSDSMLKHQKRYEAFRLKNNLNGRVYDENEDDFELSELVIVLDEARSLLQNAFGGYDSSALQNLLDSLHDLGMKNIVLVLVDTLYCFDTLPITENHGLNSYKRPQKGHNIFDPFYEILTTDVMVPPNKLSELCRLDEITVHSLTNLLSQGRPLWGALFFQESPWGSNIRAAVRYARKKLVYTARITGDFRGEAVFAASSIRFGIRGIVDHTLATKLIFCYMGTCMYIGEDRIRMVVRYPAEPILSEAACQSLYDPPSYIPERERILHFSPIEVGRSLMGFICHCVNGYINAGPIEGLIARIILSLTFDRIILDRYDLQRQELDNNVSSSSSSELNCWPIFSYAVNLKDFINGLVSEVYLKAFGAFQDTLNAEIPVQQNIEMYIPEGLKEGLVAFNTWTAMAQWNESNSTLEDFLKLCISKRTAIILPPEHPGANLLIPILTPDESLGFLLIRVVNNEVFEDPEESLIMAGEELEPKFCFGTKWFQEITEKSMEYMSLYIEIGSDPEPFKRFSMDEMKEFKELYPNHLILLGFDSMNISTLEPFKQIFECYYQRPIDHVEMSHRYAQLKLIEPAGFLGSYHHCDCKWHDTCFNNKCSCQRIGLKCSEKCACSLRKVLSSGDSEC